MERFVFVAAITIALIYGAFQLIGGGHSMTFNIGDFEGAGAQPVIEVSAGQIAEQSYANGDIEIRHAAARIVITPEDRTDISVAIDNPGHAPMPEITTREGRLIIDGRLGGRIDECQDEAVDLRGYGVIAIADLPLITIRAPRTLSLDIGGGSVTEVGPSQELEASFSGCGTSTVGDVAGAFGLELAGSGHVNAGGSRILKADVAGSGELHAGAVSESADIDIAGSGEVDLASLTGSLGMDSAGSGNLRIRGGAISEANVDLAGSGGVEIAASIQRLEVAIVGSGDVEIAGVVGEIDADIAGSGGVSAQSVTGAIRKEVWGSGDVRVGG